MQERVYYIRIYSGQDACRKGQDACRKGQMQDMIDAGQVSCKNMWERIDAGQEG